MRSTAPLPVAQGYEGEVPPDDWLLSDGFNMPVTRQTQRRTDVLQSSFEVRVAEGDVDASILANVPFRWDPEHQGVGVDPDLLWVEPSLPAGMRSVLTWKPGVAPPRLAVEVVSRDTAHKDYNRGPMKYATSGVRELWVFDPEGFGRTDDERGPWILQVWRPVRGAFRCVYRGDGPCFSKELRAWVVVVGDELRVAADEAGQRLWPTALERSAQERARADQEAARRAQSEQRLQSEELARRDAEARAESEALARRDAEARAQSEALARRDAEARLRALEAELQALQAAKPPKRPRRR